jgi:hypothetical protein
MKQETIERAIRSMGFTERVTFKSAPERVRRETEQKIQILGDRVRRIQVGVSPTIGDQSAFWTSTSKAITDETKKPKKGLRQDGVKRNPNPQRNRQNSRVLRGV